jgi:hypothetical protein
VGRIKKINSAKIDRKKGKRIFVKKNVAETRSKIKDSGNKNIYTKH